MWPDKGFDYFEVDELIEAVGCMGRMARGGVDQSREEENSWQQSEEVVQGEDAFVDE